MKAPPSTPKRVDPLDWMGQPGVAEDLAKSIAQELKHRKRRRIGGTGIALLLLSLLVWRPWVAEPLAPATTAFVRLPATQTLADGSTVQLNDGARILTAFTGTVRRVELLSGEAHFQVTKDPSKPFIVVVDDVEVRAVGTAFSVTRNATKVEVLVTEGTVAVDRPSESISSSAPTSETIATLGVGGRAVVNLASAETTAPHVEALPLPAVQERLSWRMPRLEFTETPLNEAIPMINMHSPVKLILKDSSLGSLKISGVIRADNIDLLRDLLSDTHGIQSEYRTNSEVVLTRSR